MADVIDHRDVNIYRQLAGGVTAVNVLHGSCNAIGGENAVLKLRSLRNLELAKSNQSEFLYPPVARMLLMLLFIAAFLTYLRMELLAVYRDNGMLATFTLLTLAVLGSIVALVNWGGQFELHGDVGCGSAGGRRQRGEHRHGDEAAGGQRTMPVQATGLSRIVAIAAGGSFGLALHDDGTVYSWGVNDVGQLGNGATSPREGQPQLVVER